MKPQLKAPGTKSLKLKRGLLLSKYAFKFNLRLYTKRKTDCCGPSRENALVGRCRLTVSKSVWSLKAPTVSALETKTR